MYGDIISDDNSLSYCNCCTDCNNCDSGYINTYRKTCGNTDVLNDIETPYCESGVDGYPNDKTWLVNTDHVFSEADLEYQVDKKVYAQIEDAISDVINKVILNCVQEGLNGCVSVRF